jgi:hypothetical protein
MDQKLPIEVDRARIDALPDHACAYCGSRHAVLQNIEQEPPMLLFSIYCNSCGKIDRPMLQARELMKVLRAIG